MYNSYRIAIKAMNKIKIKAFSLLEISIAIFITGIIFSSLFPVFKLITKSQEEVVNEEKAKQIRIAVQNYVLLKGHLPFAASNLNGRSANNIWSGFVPYKDLGIKESLAQSAAKIPFKFIVNINFCKKEGEKFIPLHVPLYVFPALGCVSFCRLYDWSADGKIVKYDKACLLDDLDVFDKGESVILPENDVFIMKDVQGISGIGDVNDWLISSLSSKDEKFRCCNKVAWVLIAPKKRKSLKGQKLSACQINNDKADNKKICYAGEKNDLGVFYDKVFFQTRFDLASQIGFNCTSHGLYV
jgi:type II secretory pathway pseudopilin PulG